MDTIKILIIFILVVAITLYLPFVSGRVKAHWHGYRDRLATHDYMILLALRALENDNATRGGRNTQYLNFLRPYVNILIQGVRDADLRANGIYAIDCGCEDPAENDVFHQTTQCPTSSIRCNDLAEISDFFVGDHGYNPFTREGLFRSQSYFADRENAWRIEDILRNYAANPNPNCTAQNLSACGRDGKLYVKLAGTTVEQKIETLKQEMDRSNAAILAEFFFNRARETWRQWQRDGQEQRRVDALYNLGIALHMVQDVTNPEHTRLRNYERPLSCDSTPYTKGYEGYVWECYLRGGDERDPRFPREVFSIRGDYSILAAREWVERTSLTASRWGEQALDPTAIVDPSTGETSAAAAVRLGVSSTVGLLVSFFEMQASGPTELIQNGGFEQGLDHWVIPDWSRRPDLRPTASSSRPHTGNASLLLGAISSPEPLGTTGIYQQITIPAEASSATLRFWYWPAAENSFNFFSRDRQALVVYDGSGNQTLLLWERKDDQRWLQSMEYNLLPWRGQTILLLFYVIQDGDGDRTYMYVDDVSVTYTAGETLR